MSNPHKPFGTIESTQEYLMLLNQRIDEVLDEVRREVSACKRGELSYRVQAWQLVLYTMTKLSSHIETSRKLMQNLDELRMMLDGNRVELERVVRDTGVSSAVLAAPQNLPLMHEHEREEVAADFTDY